MGDVEKLNIELFQHESNPLSHHRNYAEWVEYAYPNNAINWMDYNSKS